MQKNRFGLWRFGSLKESAFSANAQSRFASALFDGVLGALHLVRLTLRCPSISRSNARGRRRLLKGALSSKKALQGSETETEELQGGTEEKSVFPMRGR